MWSYKVDEEDGMMNLNKGCIEMILVDIWANHKEQMNLNKGCIEIIIKKKQKLINM